MPSKTMIDMINQVEIQATDAVDRARIVAAAVAVAISRTRPIPSAPVVSPPSYFVDQVLPQALSLIDEYNEEIILDVKYCTEMLRTFWMVRYTAAHNSHAVVPAGSYTFFETMMGVPNMVAEVDMCFFAKYQLPIYLLAVYAQNVIDEKKGGPQ